MRNLYSVVTNQEALRRIAQAFNDHIGNLPELPGIYPDYLAPIIRMNAQNEREIVLARWGLPSLKDQPTEKPNRGTTNVRRPWFDDWKGYLGVEHRCLVPLTRFAEPCKLEDGSSGNAWFTLSKDEPLTFFAGQVQSLGEVRFAPQADIRLRATPRRHQLRSAHDPLARSQPAADPITSCRSGNGWPTLALPATSPNATSSKS
jgi:putative SOS response-associated peptidase YedK